MRPSAHRLLVILLAALAAWSPAMAAGDRRILVMLSAAPSHFRPDTGYGGGYADTVGKAARARTARRIARAHALKLIDQWPMPLLDIDCFVMVVADARTDDAVIDELAHEPAVAWSQPLNRFHGRQAPPARPDPMLAAQPAEKLWRLDRLHRLATGRGTIVAVIDSRIDAAHPDLAGQVLLSRDFTTDPHKGPERHGTNVAGVIAARAGNGIGISGIAPGASLLGLRACWEEAAETVCDSLSLAKAMQFAIERAAPVINLSLSGPDDRLLTGLVGIGLRRGAVIVAAIDPARVDGGFPARLAGVLAIADRPLARGEATGYTAPGRDIPTTGPGGTWALVNGSSFAAAHVSGLVALLREHGAGPPRFALLPGRAIDACRTLACANAAHEADCAAPCSVR